MANESIPPKEEPKEDPVAKVIADLGEAVEGIKSHVDERISSIEEKLPTAPIESEPEPETTQTDKWVPNSWEDIPKKAEEIFDTKITKIQEEEAEKERVEQENLKQMDTFWDKQISDLEKNNTISPVKDPNDPNDQGKLDRQELYGVSIRFKNVDLENVGKFVGDLHKSGKKYDTKTATIIDYTPTKKSSTSDNKNVPVGSSANRTYSGSTYKPTRKEIKALSMDELARRYTENA